MTEPTPENWSMFYLAVIGAVVMALLVIDRIWHRTEHWRFKRLLKRKGVKTG